MKSEIAIVGGGMVGVAQAIALADAGVAVTVFDREEPAEMLARAYDGRVSAVAWKSYQFLDKIGAWKFILPHAQPINDIRVSDADSLLFTHFDHKEIGDDAFGYIVENRHIRIGLHKRAEELKNLQLKIQDTKEIPQGFELVIAADGKFSKIRALAGIGISQRNYKQSGIVCTIEHELAHEGLAHEKFLPAGPFAVLPMQGNRSSLVWTEPTELAPIYMEMSDAEFLAEIEKRCDYLGKITLVEGRWSYPLSLTHAENYVADGLALVGDAAHSIHPIAGQGVNLGFRDVIELTSLIVRQKRLGLPLSAALPEYERARKLDNSMMIFATDTLNRLFSNNIAPIRIARDLGLGVVNEIPLLKKFFMKAASGKF